MNEVLYEVRYFWTAVMLLTRLPAPRLKGFQDGWLARSALYFPIVGLVVGLFAAAVHWGAYFLWPEPVPSVLAVAAAALITGGLHEDGWADVFDALAASREPKRMLEVMKDSRIGAAGALALVLLLLAKVSVLGTFSAGRAANALVAAHVLSRWSHLPLLWRLPYARPEGGLAGPLAGRVSGMRVAIGTILTVGITFTALYWLVLPSLTVALVATLAAGFFFRRRLGGITGDCLGAVNQLVELGVLLTLAAPWPVE
jgi:adenosylcobinamide-GDP ribazoletransferase